MSNVRDDGAAVSELTFKIDTSVDNNPCLREHVIFGRHLMPSDYYLDLVYRTARAHLGLTAFTIEGLVIPAPLIGVPGASIALHVIFKPSAGRWLFAIKSDDGTGLRIRVKGTIVPSAPAARKNRDARPPLDGAAETITHEAMYRDHPWIRSGPIYWCLEGLQITGESAASRVTRPKEAAEIRDRFELDPSIVSSMLMGPLSFAIRRSGDPLATFVPLAIGRVEIFGRLDDARYTLVTHLRSIDGETMTLDVDLVDENDDVALSMIGFKARRIRAKDLGGTESVPDSHAGTAVAIVGCSGRFPKADDVEAFWKNLAAGLDCIVEIPSARWDVGAAFDPDPRAPNKTMSKWGGYIDGVDLFDPSFFGISPVEAESMDPQHRLFLEEAYHALEDAGLRAADVKGRKCGVFVGASIGDYETNLFKREMEATAHAFTGMSEAILAARISYFLDLKGPAIPVDTACSSSLVAVALACRSILDGESDMAIAGGVFVMVTPKLHVKMSKSGMLSKRGQCRTFDAAADGTVIGEAVGALVLKPLADAIRDRDPIHGVIRGFGVNQNGKTNGITAPNPAAQAQLERYVYDRFAIDPRTIGYVETHGTGTGLGDPAEVDALTSTFQRYTQDKQFCVLGGVKPNIGHATFAAGAAGLIKVLLAFKNRQFPPSIHFNEASPLIDLASGPFRVTTELAPWEDTPTHPRRAAVSSFGFSGANCHLVVEEGPRDYIAASPAKPCYLIALTAKTEGSLRAIAQRLSAWLRTTASASISLSDIAFTLLVRRNHFRVRRALVVTTRSDLVSQLDAIANGTEPAPLKRAPSSGTKDAGNALVRRLGRDPLSNDAYARTVAEAAAHFAAGQDLAWAEWLPATKHRTLSLPGYAFEKRRCWIDAPAPQATSSSPTAPIANTDVDGVWPLTVRATANRTESVAARLDTRELARRWDLLERLGARFIEAALRDLFGDDLAHAKGGVVTDMRGVLPRYQPLLRRWLGEHGRAAGTISSSPSGSPGPSDLSGALAEAHRACVDETHAVALAERCGARLAAVLRGEQDPRELLFPKGSFDLVEGLFQDSPLTRAYTEMLAGAVSGIVAALPRDRTLRVLEIGAGTASATAALVPHFPSDRTRYVFTDVSRGFFDHAREKLVRFPFIEYATFDIDRDPSAQGFALASFDVIIAADVLHAAVDASNAVARLRTMLAPGGIALIHEVTQKSAWFDVTFGLVMPPLDDHAERDGQPFLSAEKWESRLRAADFADVVRLPKADSALGGFGQHVLLARASGTGAFSLPMTTPGAVAHRARPTAHPLLGARIHAAHPTFELTAGGEPLRYLADHRVYDTPILPGAAYVEIGLAAAAQIYPGRPFALDNVRIREPLVWPTGQSAEGAAPAIQVVVSKTGTRPSFEVFSALPGASEWTQHATGAFALGDVAGVTAHEPLDAVLARCRETKDIEAYYAAFARRGIDYGPSFRTIERLWLGEGEAVGAIALREPHAAGSYTLHPALLDGCFQLMLAGLPKDASDVAYVPVGIDRITAFAPAEASVLCHAKVRPTRDVAAASLEAELVLFNRDGKVIARLDGVRIARASEEALRGISHPVREDWLYGPTWARSPAVTEASAPPSGTWLVLADDGGVARAFAAKVTEHGGRCALVSARQRPESGPTDDYPKDGRMTPLYLVDPNDENALRRVGAEGLAGAPWDHIVHMWSLDTPPPSDAALPSPSGSDTLGPLSVLHVLQGALGTARSNPQLTIVTRGSQSVVTNDDVGGLLQSPLWGLGRVIALEHPELRCTRVDLDPSATNVDRDAAALFGTVTTKDGEDQIAFRAGDRYIARLARRHSPSTANLSAEAKAPPIVLANDATYAIVGGLGGLGLAVAHWMVDHGARHILLIGRTAPSEHARSAIADLGTRGATVETAAVDVADRAALASLIARCGTSMPALRGVVHAAAVLRDGVFLKQTRESFADVFAAKVAGAWNLHALTKDLPLDFFVLFSSQASLLGSGGQASYASACAFEDALAHYRRARGLPALSINWGPWSEIGIAARGNVGDRAFLEQNGIGTIPPRSGLSIFGLLLGERAPQIGVMPIDWNRYVRRSPSPFLANLADAPSPVKRGDPTTRDIVDTLSTAAIADRVNLAIDYVASEVAQILGEETPAKVDRTSPLVDLGMDSLMAVELRNRLALGTRTQKPLPATLIYDYPTITAIGAYIVHDVLGLDRAAGAGSIESATRRDVLLEEIENLDDEESRQLLASTLDSFLVDATQADSE